MSFPLLKCHVVGVVVITSTTGCSYLRTGESTLEGDEGGQWRGVTNVRGSGGSGAKSPKSGATPGSGGACTDPTLGVTGPFSFVTFTGTITNQCVAGNTEPCSDGFRSASDVAIDYGSFPFDRRARRDYFYAVFAAGHEEELFSDGAEGNLSDTSPSGVLGDLGSGDSVANRTLKVGIDPVIGFFPSSPGTHPFSFPPSQFMTIHLAPFDTTPSNDYVAVICPTNVKSRCECAFDRFQIVPREADGGLDAGSGTGGAGGTGGEGVHDAGMDAADSCPDATADHVEPSASDAMKDRADASSEDARDSSSPG